MAMPAAASAAAPKAVFIQHSREFRTRRFLNWFPLGITYATFYMGRYNFYVATEKIQNLFSLNKAEIGIVASAGFIVYALSVAINGPLADRFGGKKAIMLGTAGAAIMNLIIGLLFWCGWHPAQKTPVIATLSILFAFNCYFQSFGALSVVKVNAAWFHVRERGVFGGIFGIMISCGYSLAFSVGGLILKYLPFHFIFIVPAGLLVVLFFIILFQVKETPKDAGLENFDTADASSGDATPVNWKYLFNKIFTNPIILTIAAAEFCTGFVRQALMFYFPRFLKEVHHIEAGSAISNWAGIGVTVGGICGGLLCGILSDRFFESRRPPVALLFYIGQIIALLALGLTGNGILAASLVGVSCMWIFGVHGMLSGTASADFGGKKAAATATGLLDGVQYLGGSLTGIGLGHLLDHYGWGIWTYMIIPFSIIGIILMFSIWNAKPQPKGASAH
jgi:OPA family glycerol-3-phosphate transporter-like MFS transporter